MTTEPKIVLEHMPPKDLTPYDLNAKKHDKNQVAKIAQAISRFGFDQPIVVDRNGVIIKGHGRRLAAIELGLKTVPVWVRRDLTPDEVRAARLSDNRVALSDLDTELLRADLSTMESELLDGIFDDKEIDFGTSDLGLMNEGVFETDMDAVLDEKQRDLDARAEAAASESARVPVAKAFGFKDIAASAVIVISQLMARAEAATGLKNDAALVAYIGETK